MWWKYPPAISRLGSPPKSVLSWKPSLWNQRKRNPARPFRNQLSSFEYILLSCWGRTCGRLCRRVLLVPPGDWRYTLRGGDISISIEQTNNESSITIKLFSRWLDKASNLRSPLLRPAVTWIGDTTCSRNLYFENVNTFWQILMNIKDDIDHCDIDHLCLLTSRQGKNSHLVLLWRSPSQESPENGC